MSQSPRVTSVTAKLAIIKAATEWLNDGLPPSALPGRLVDVFTINTTQAKKLATEVIERWEQDNPDPATAEYEHIKRQWASRPEVGNDEPTNES